MVLEIHLLNLFTGAAHQLAAKPILNISDLPLRNGRCTISIEIIGDILAMLVMFPFSHGIVSDYMYIFDWKIGELSMVCVIDLLMLSTAHCLTPYRPIPFPKQLAAASFSFLTTSFFFRIGCINLWICSVSPLLTQAKSFLS
jgi:hypothetical protein